MTVQRKSKLDQNDTSVQQSSTSSSPKQVQDSWGGRVWKWLTSFGDTKGHRFDPWKPDMNKYKTDLPTGEGKTWGDAVMKRIYQVDDALVKFLYKVFEMDDESKNKK